MKPTPDAYDEEEKACPCASQGCPEHPYHSGFDHTFQQHHDPTDHEGDDTCDCTMYA